MAPHPRDGQNVAAERAQGDDNGCAQCAVECGVPAAGDSGQGYAWRGCGSTFHLGATMDTNGTLIAHAWLVSGGEVVIGAANIPSISPLAHFG
jgi:Transglutaminase-like superfamily